jgi:hypothetical protein
MYDLAVYSKKFFQKRYKLNWRAPIIHNILHSLYTDTSVIDYGGGNFDILSEFSYWGSKILGVEGNDNCKEYIHIQQEYLRIFDLRIQIPMEDIPTCDLALCLEVAEHIEEEYVNVVINNIARHSVVVFSAAPPGQLGVGHVNLQYPAYWRDLFRCVGYYVDKQGILDVRDHLFPYRQKPGIKAYYSNLLIFKKDM